MPRRAPLLLFLGAALLPGLAYAVFIWRHYPAALLTDTNSLVVRDFLVPWSAGRLARAGDLATLFSPDDYMAWLRAAFGARLDLHLWVYPPSMLLLAIPFSLPPLVPGFVLWTLATAGFLAGVLRTAGLGAAGVLAVLASPAVLENALAGQNGALTAAALAGGLLFAGRHPTAAGALLGLLTLKPQLGLLVPVCLLAAREWRSIGWTAGFALLFAALPMLAFGPGIWLHYMATVSPGLGHLVHAPLGLAFQAQMPSPFITARALGFGITGAYAVQATATLCCVAMVAWAWRRVAGAEARRSAVALALLLTPLASPYGQSYDLVAGAVAVVLLAEGWRRSPPDRLEVYALGLAWIWPGIALVMGAAVTPGLGPLMLLPAVGVALRRLRGRIPAE